MRKLLVSFLLCLSAIIAFGQSNSNRTLYVYRNDGCFNAFYYSEIDSMQCSVIDTMGIKHENYVIQEIYTVDSLYRIPLTAIDSISFVTPKTKYRSNVQIINDSWLNYVISVDNLKIILNKSIPSNLIPVIGQVLVSETRLNPFENGFAGRVSKINREEDGIIILCTDVTLKDIYKTFVYKGRSKSYTNVSETREKKQENRSEIETIYFDIPHNLSFSLGPLSLNVSPTIALDYIICINDDQTYIDNRITHYYDCSVQLDCEFTGEYNPEPDLALKVPIPTEVPGLYAEISLGTFFECSGGVIISMNQPFTITGTTGYVAYDDHATDIDEWYFEAKDTKFTANLNGQIRFGLATQAKLAFVTEKLASIDVTGYFGPEVSANITLSSEGLLDGSLYSSLKESVVTLSAYGAVKPGWRFAGFEHQKLNNNPSFHFELNHWYILPEFNNLLWTQNQGTKGGKLNGGINRDLFWPGVQLGWSLYDPNEHFYASQYYPETYRLGSEWPWKGLELDINDLPYGSKFTAYPMIKIWGYEMKALPSTEVSISPLVNTGNVANIEETSAITSGYVEGLEYSMITDVGICYSTSNPISGNFVSSGGKKDGYFSVSLSELISNTTYYYCAYAYFDGNYYYGEVSSFKTKKKENPTPNPDPDQELSPVAITGTHYNETTTTATIECTYQNVASGADCGYFFYEESDFTSGGISSNRSLGNVEGTQVIPLSGLKPNTTYYYQAYIKHDGKSYLGDEQSFKTVALNPIATTGGYSDVTDKSAIVECSFENVPEGGKCYVFLQWEDDGNYKMVTFDASEGKNKKILCSNLKPSTTYYYTAAISYDGKEYTGEEKSFTTKDKEIPDLSGTWTFNQTYLGAHTVTMNLKLKEKGSNWATYTASGFYGVITFNCTVNSNRSISLSLNASNGAHGAFSGTFNEDFTSVSGDSYLYVPDNNNWAVSPWTVNDPWTFSR